jgi:hypothetical protein
MLKKQIDHGADRFGGEALSLDWTGETKPELSVLVIGTTNRKPNIADQPVSETIGDAS